VPPTKKAKIAEPRRVPKERPGPVGGKRDRNRRERTRTLLEAGLTLFLERGLEQVTIDEIAREAGMAKGNFYRYFQDKRDLVDAVMEPVATEIRAAMSDCGAALEAAGDEPSLVKAYEGLAFRFATVAIGNIEVLRLYLQESRGPAVGARASLAALAEEVSDGAIELTRLAVAHGLLEVSDPRISALAVVGATEQLALAMMRGRIDDIPPQQLVQTLIGMVLHGIRPAQATGKS
jgi:AcrR family transcriptional regulator